MNPPRSTRQPRSERISRLAEERQAPFVRGEAAGGLALRRAAENFSNGRPSSTGRTPEAGKPAAKARASRRAADWDRGGAASSAPLASGTGTKLAAAWTAFTDPSRVASSSGRGTRLGQRAVGAGSTEGTSLEGDFELFDAEKAPVDSGGRGRHRLAQRFRRSPAHPAHHALRGAVRRRHEGPLDLRGALPPRRPLPRAHRAGAARRRLPRGPRLARGDRERDEPANSARRRGGAVPADARHGAAFRAR